MSETLIKHKKSCEDKRCYEYPPTGKAAVRASSYIDLGESKQDLPKGNQAPPDLQLTGLLVCAGFLIHHFPALMMTYSIFCLLTLGEKGGVFFMQISQT